VDRCFAGLVVFSREWDVFISEFWRLTSNVISSFTCGQLMFC